jgi:hypothetical protein
MSSVMRWSGCPHGRWNVGCVREDGYPHELQPGILLVVDRCRIGKSLKVGLGHF